MSGSDRGSGSVAALAVGLALTAVLSLAVPLYTGLATRHSLTEAADAAALAAADTLSGLLPGDPCGSADRVARANGSRTRACVLDGLVATVEVGRTIWGIPVTAVATAGPAGSGLD